eukprot:TRINITY_DN9787_c3_g1_i1.p1 TRINITY_DN9787_c3_g1~~TRINITY_DN9787_c3_g1_i1.p1  ORF type:complete len:615 (-),score=131.31 TRINITY_DN9787_c3_g1_i1:171-2015(-)
MAEYNYEKVAAAAAEQVDGHYCWPVEWFKEDLPIENKDGSAMDKKVCKLINASSKVPSLLTSYTKAQSKEPVELPLPEKPVKSKVLVFTDSVGYCDGVLSNAPEGRIGFKKVVTDSYSLDQEAMAKIIGEQKKGWDIIVFGLGCDPPKSNKVPDIIEQNAVISKLYFWLLQEVQKQSATKQIFVLTRGNFAEDKKTHSKAGLGLTVGGTLFGMSNTGRQELEDARIHYCDTEYFVEEARATDLWERVAAEMFRVTTFGHMDVRILHSGRYVQKKVSSKAYQAANVDWIMPTEGVIGISGGNGALGIVMTGWLLDKAEEQGVKGFSIQLLSRSMKVADTNIAIFNKTLEKAERLGISVTHAKLDMSSQEGMDKFFKEMNGRLVGFIHSAGVLQDSMLFNLTWEKFETVFASKHWAALYLHDSLERFSNPGLRFLWMFSSTSVYGNMGQTNYSGSNSFLDALSRHRKAKGKVSLAIQWGAWGEVGMAANMTDAMRHRMNQSPMPGFSNWQGLDGLEKGLMTGLPYFAVFKFNPPMALGMVQSGDHPNMCHHRNHYAEILPTPMAPNLNPEHLYTVYRMGLGPQHKNPNAERLVYNAYVKDAAEKYENEWGDDFRNW